MDPPWTTHDPPHDSPPTTLHSHLLTLPSPPTDYMTPRTITLESAIASSRTAWIRDLRSAHDHAKERFGDVSWDEEGLEGSDGAGDNAEYGDGSEGREEGTGTGMFVKSGRGSIRIVARVTDRIFAHKAMVHARASKGFKDHYFPATHSSHALGYRTPSPYLPHLSPSLHDLSSTSSPSRTLPQPGARSPSCAGESSIAPSHLTPYGRASSEGAGTLVLDHKGTPELVRANLQWMYTSEGGAGGGVIGSDWFAAAGEREAGGLGTRLIGRAGTNGLYVLGVGRGSGDKDTDRVYSGSESAAERREKLSQDLVYMWRSKLYSDIKIRLQVNAPPGMDRGTSDTLGSRPSSFLRTPKSHPAGRASSRRSHRIDPDGRASVATTAHSTVGDSDFEGGGDDSGGRSGGSIVAFSAHRFMLCSRSPYFAQVLLNGGAFAQHGIASSPNVNASTTSVAIGRQDRTPEILLPTPPFTPIALHFVLGYIYSGSLGFSHRSFDLNTAFAVYRAAIFLEIDPLLAEVEARITWDFCGGFPLEERMNARPGNSMRKKWARRISRVWRFALAPDVGAVSLASRAATYIVNFWGDCLGKEVAQVEEVVRNRLVERILNDITVETVVRGYESLLECKQRLDGEKAGAVPSWEGVARSIVEEIEAQLRSCLARNIESVVAQANFQAILDPMLTKSGLLDTVLQSLAEGCGRPDLCEQAPQAYQAVVGSLLTGTKPDSEDLILPLGSKHRESVESARSAILAHIKRRWMHIKTAKAFNSLEYWALKEISDDIEVEVQDLLEPERKLRVSTRSHASLTPDDVTRASPAVSRVAALKTRKVDIAPSPGSLAAAARLRVQSSASRASGLIADTDDRRTVRSVRAIPVAGRLEALGSPVSAVSPGGAKPARSGVRVECHAGISDAASIQTARSATRPQSRVSTLTVNAQAGPSTPTRRSTKLTRAGQAAAGMEVTPPIAPSIKKPAPSQTVPGLARLRATSAASVASSKMVPSGKIAAAVGASSTVTSGKSVAPRRPDSDAQWTRSSKSDTGGPAMKIAPKPIGKETATSQTRVAPVHHRGSPLAGESDAKPSVTPSIRSIASVRSVVRPKTPTTGSLHVSRAVPAGVVPPVPARGSQPSRPVAREGSVASLKTLRLKPVPKPGSSALTSSASRSRTQSEAGPSSNLKTPTKSKVAPEKTVFPSPSRKTASPTRRLETPSRTVKEASTSTDGGDASEAMTPVASDTEGLVAPHIVRKGSGDSDAALGPTLNDLLRESPTYRTVLGKSSFRKPSLPLPLNYRSYDRSAIRMRAASATSSVHSHSHPAHAFDPPPRPPESPWIQVTDENVPPDARSGVGLQVGIPCIVALGERKARLKALCRYIGRMNDSPGPWVGVEIAEYVGVKYGLEGLSDGSSGGVRYFHLTPIDEGVGMEVLRNSGTASRSMANRREVGRKVSMPNSSMGRAPSLRGDDGPMSASFAGTFDPISRTSSPTPGYVDSGHPNHWIQGAFGPANGRTRSLFVQPNEVVFVLGAAE